MHYFGSFTVLIERQLAYQLPGKKFNLQDEIIFKDPMGAPKHSKMTECDFAQLDKMLVQKPNISIISLNSWFLTDLQ